MLRITHERTTDGASVLKLEGRVAGPWVNELRQAAVPLIDRQGGVVFDLSGVTYADPEGTQALKELLARGVEIRGRSTFVAALLNDRGNR